MAARKALSAGLHKDVPNDDVQTAENIEERRITFWSLYLYETSVQLRHCQLNPLTLLLGGSVFILGAQARYR